MHLTHDRTRRTAGTVSLLAALLLVLNALFLAAPASADKPVDEPQPLPESPYPALVAGNPTCERYGLVEITRFDDGPTGEVGDELTQDGVTITITEVKDEGEILTFDWTSTSWVSAVIVKAGNEANVYVYDPSVTSGSAVTVGTHGVSHVSFCEGDEPGDVPVTPAAPDFVEPTCANENTASVVINPTVGVLYTTIGDQVPGGAVTVTATAQEGYVLEGTSQWPHTFAEAETPCGEQPVEVTPEAPSFSDPTCEDPTAILVVPDDTDAVTYQVDGAPGAGATVVVTAVVSDGYVFPDGAQTVWEHTYAPEPTDCEQPPNETVAPAASTSVQCETPFVTLDNTGSDVLVVFQVSGAVEGGILEVPVAAGETETVDLVLAEDSTYEVTIAAEGMEDVTASGTYDCEQTQVEPDTVVRPQVSFVDPTCEDPDGAEVVATPVDGITYGLVGEVAPGGTVTVTASAEGGYAIPEGQRTEWTHTFADPDDCVEVAPQVIEKPQPAPAAEVQSEQLAATGLDSVEMLLLALLLLGLGAMALLAPAPRRGR